MPGHDPGVAEMVAHSPDLAKEALLTLQRHNKRLSQQLADTPTEVVILKRQLREMEKEQRRVLFCTI